MNPCQRASYRVLEACQILSPVRRVTVRRPLGMNLACPPAAAPCHRSARRLIFEKRDQDTFTYGQQSMTQRHAARRPPSGVIGPPAVSSGPMIARRVAPPRVIGPPCHVIGPPSVSRRPPSSVRRVMPRRPYYRDKRRRPLTLGHPLRVPLGKAGGK